MKHIDIVFEKAPSGGDDAPKGPRFVEVEDEEGKSIGIGKWIEREDGYWALRIPIARPGEVALTFPKETE